MKKFEATVMVFLSALVFWYFDMAISTFLSFTGAFLVSYWLIAYVTGRLKTPMRSIDCIRAAICPNCTNPRLEVRFNDRSSAYLDCPHCGSHFRVFKAIGGGVKRVQGILGTTLKDDGR